jgi:hypothetical protein
VQILLTVIRGSHISVWRVEVSSCVTVSGECAFGLDSGDVGFEAFVILAGVQLEADGVVVVVSSRHLPNQPGVLQVVVVVVVEVVLDEVVVVVVVVVVSSKQPHQPGVLQVEVLVRVLAVDDFVDEVVVVMELLES